MIAASRRTRILLFVMHYYEAHGYGPSVRDVGEAVGLYSSSTVHRHLMGLRRDGLLTWNPGLSRTLRPTVRRVR